MWLLGIIVFILTLLFFGDRWQFHTIVVGLLYTYLLYVWVGGIFYKGPEPPKTFYILILSLYAMPLIFLYHLCFIGFAKSRGLDRIKQINTAGLILCIVHLATFFLTFFL